MWFSDLFSQNNNPSYISGDFQLNLQTYNEDSSIGAISPNEFLLLNSFSNLLFEKGNFKLGLRYEAYLNALLDFDSRFNGTGIPYKFASFSIDNLEVTLGNYYEQYGSGLIFRSYQDYNLGIDNSMNGVKLKYNPVKGLTLKGFIGEQRYFFEHGLGIIRGVDGEIFINQLLNKHTNLIMNCKYSIKFKKFIPISISNELEPIQFLKVKQYQLKI